MAMLVDNEKMKTAVKEFHDASESFAKLGAQFIADLTNALSTFEGETKDVLMSKKIGASGGDNKDTLAYFVEKQIPELIDGLSQLLEGNRDTIEKSDQQLADAIKGQ